MFRGHIFSLQNKDLEVKSMSLNIIWKLGENYSVSLKKFFTRFTSINYVYLIQCTIYTAYTVTSSIQHIHYSLYTLYKLYTVFTLYTLYTVYNRMSPKAPLVMLKLLPSIFLFHLVKSFR